MKIKEFKAVYQTMYGRDLVEHIDSEVDNYFLFVYHGQLDEIMSWLTPKADFAPADKKKVDGKGDPISAWLGKVVQEQVKAGKPDLRQKRTPAPTAKRG